MNELHLFAGAGGGILGGMLLGHVPVCAVELEPYCRQALLQRQRDGVLPWFPIWDDVRTFDGNPYRGTVQIVSGGFPCQDVSICGTAKGLDGDRSGLWSEFARILGEVRPEYAFIENSPILTSRGLDRVLSDLAALGFVGSYGVVGASDAGAPHERKRIWILAHARKFRPGVEREEVCTGGYSALTGGPDVSHALQRGQPNPVRFPASEAFSEVGPSFGLDDWEGPTTGAEKGWPAEPGVGRVAYGMADGMDRLAALGNGQVPRVVSLAFRLLHRRLTEN